MTNHEISAEDLALYALGALTPEEQASIAAHLESCAPCRTELMKLRGDAALLAISSPSTAPPARSRQRLLDEIGKTPAPAKAPVRLGAPWWQVTLPTLIAMALIVFALWLVGQNAMIRRELDEARLNAAQQSGSVEQARQVIETLNAKDAQRVTLVAAQTKPQPQAQTIYQREKGRLVLVASHLESIPQDKTYELWILPANGSAPIPAGTFKPDANGNASLVLPQIPTGIEAKGFAVTVENQGGSATPTMPIKMLGTAS